MHNKNVLFLSLYVYLKYNNSIHTEEQSDVWKCI